MMNEKEERNPGAPGRENTSMNCPRYLVVESATPGKPLDRHNPFTIGKWLDGVASKLSEHAKSMRDKVLVDCPSQHVSKLLLQRDGTYLMPGVKLTVTEHRNLNISRGVIWCPRVSCMPVEELLEELREQGVSKVERCTRKKGGDITPIHTYFLTFDRPSPPEEIRISFHEKVRVGLYVPRPLQCFKCFKFGHTSSKCKGKAMCRQCGRQAHENDCRRTKECSNCKGNHSPTSKQCPSYRTEAEIKKIMVQNKVSFKEAKKRVEKSCPYPGLNYAAAARAGMQNQAPRNTVTSRGVQYDVADPVQRKSNQCQSDERLPEVIFAVALACAREFGESLRKKKKNETSAGKRKTSALQSQEKRPAK